MLLSYYYIESFMAAIGHQGAVKALFYFYNLKLNKME